MFGLKFKSIKSKIIALFVTSITLLLIIFGLVLNTQLSNSILKENEEYNSIIARNVSNQISEWLQASVAKLQGMALPIEEMGIDQEKNREYITKVAKAHAANFETIVCADLTGMRVNSVDDKVASLADRDYFQAIVKNPSLPFVISDPVKSKSTGNDIIVAAIPLKDKTGQLIGVLGGTIPVNTIVDIVNSVKIGEEGYAWVYNKAGLVVFHKNEKIRQQLNIKKAESFGFEGLEKVDEIDGEKEVHAIYFNNNNGKDTYGFTSKIKNSPGWTLVLSLPETQILAAANSTRTQLIILIVILLAVVIGISFFISNSITRPIQLVKDFALSLQKGIISARASLQETDEIGEMGNALDKMADQLQGITQAMDKVSHGDVAVTLPLSSDADEITPALNGITEKLRGLIAETKYFTNAANEGKLSTRGDLTKFEGGYRDIVVGFNETLNAVIAPIDDARIVLATMAKGDLTARIEKEYKGDFNNLKNNINMLSDSMSGALYEVAEAVQATASASTQISSSTEEMASGAHEQTSQAHDVASAVEEMTKTILETTKNANSAADSAGQASKIAIDGGKSVDETINGMNRITEVVEKAAVTVRELGRSSSQIGEIIQVINDIADQTNLLALNAAIEAARAGEQGRGFAVVADEVRKLAERTGKATKEIADMIKKIQRDTTEAVDSIELGTKEVVKGRELANNAGASLKQIINKVSETVDGINQVAAASEEQSSAAEQISKSIEGISTVIQESASVTQQIAHAAEDLNRLTENLQNLITRFKIADASAIAGRLNEPNKMLR